MTAYPLGTRVRKTKGSSWQGHVVGHYSTTLTADGVCVESEREPGSVQLYPVAALELVPDVDIELERLRLKVLHAQERRAREYRHPETDAAHQWEVDEALASAQDALAKYQSSRERR